MSRLGPRARTVLDAAAVLPPAAELTLLEALAGDAVDALDECIGAGILTARDDGVAFRHELARIAVEESLSPHRRLELHRRALAALAADDGGRRGARDAPRGRRGRRRRGAPLRPGRGRARGGGRRAPRGGGPVRAGAPLRRPPSGRGARRPARAPLAGLLPHRPERARRSRPAWPRSTFAASSATGSARATRCAGSRRSSGARAAWPSAEQAAREAVARARRLPPGPELALAYGNLAGVCNAGARARRGGGARAPRARARRAARRRTRSASHALVHVGTTELAAARPRASRSSSAGSPRPSATGTNGRSGNFFLALASGAVEARDHDAAERYLDVGIALLQRPRARALPAVPARVPGAARARPRALGGGDRRGGGGASRPARVDDAADPRARRDRARARPPRRAGARAAARRGVGARRADGRAAPARAGRGRAGRGRVARGAERRGGRAHGRGARARGRAGDAVVDRRARVPAPPRRDRRAGPAGRRGAVRARARRRLARRGRALVAARLPVRRGARARAVGPRGRPTALVRRARRARRDRWRRRSSRTASASAARARSRAGRARRRGATRRT